jgi:hypothetical protein
MEYKKRLSLFVLLFVTLSSCMAQNKEILIAMDYDLNLKCENNKVYNLSEMDSMLRAEMIKHIPEQYSNFALVKKTDNVGLYEIGCVNRSGFRSCTHSNETFLFFVHNEKVILYPDNLDQNAPTSFLNKLQEQGIINEIEKEMFLKKIDAIILININREKNKPKERW